MKTLLTMFAVATFVPVSASAYGPNTAGMNSVLLDAARVHGAALPTLETLPRVLVVPAASVPRAASSVVSPELWASLPAPDPRWLNWLAQRSPGLDKSQVRLLTLEAADKLFATAVERGLSPIDFFTDPAFRGRQVYFVPQEVVEAVFGRYVIRVLTMGSGTAADGQPYRMQALLAGAGKIEALYDRGFRAGNPHFEGEFSLEARVVQTIAGPGDIAITGIVAHVGPLINPSITRMVKIDAETIRVETPLGSRERKIKPIERR